MRYAPFAANVYCTFPTAFTTELDLFNDRRARNCYSALAIGVSMPSLASMPRIRGLAKLLGSNAPYDGRYLEC